MKKWLKSFLGISLVSVFLIAALVTAMVGSSSNIQVSLPETFNVANHPPLVPLLLPPKEPQYEKADPQAVAKSQGSEIAYLSVDPAGATNTLVNTVKAEPDWSDSDQKIGWVTMSVVKYEGGNYNTVVSLSKPTPAASKAGGIYGFRTVSLSNGDQGFIKDLEEGPYPRALVVIKGDRVITIATTASEDELLKMGEGVQVAK
ncbi:MAG: hypothetical protein WC147_12765 [Syntrophomonas sp.]